MEALIAFLLGMAAWALWKKYAGRNGPPPAAVPRHREAGDHGPAAGAEDESLQDLAASLSEFYDQSGHPEELGSQEAFRRGVAWLADASRISADQVVNHCVGANGVLSAMAAAAMAQRPDCAGAVRRVVGQFPFARVWTDFFVFRYLEAQVREPVVGAVLRHVPDWWHENPLMPQFCSDFIDARVAGGETLALDADLAAAPPADAQALKNLLERLSTEHRDTLLAQFTAWERTRLDSVFLGSVGRLWPEQAGGDVEMLPGWSGVLDTVEQAFRDPAPFSVVIVGEAGAGKTAMFRELARRLQRSGWAVFEASAVDVVAGQTFIGELEQRVRSLLEHLDARRRVLWYVPNLHEMVYAGQHRQSPVGVLDMILPAIEGGHLRVVGEVTPVSLERMLQQRPRARGCFREIRLDPMGSEEALVLAQSVAGRECAADGIAMDPAVVAEALELARHYLASRALPGSIIELLRQTRVRLRGQHVTRLTRDDLFVTLTMLSGLPRSVLDDREGLDAAGLRAHFDARVMGQPEAVQCLIDRVAMLKAGLTDPGRPIGVFLFAGPTGTGKTEVAKTLAGFLFGSTDRMIRLDMSEYQDPSSVMRILGDGGPVSEVNALVNRVRKQPFAVVLLDEFEKAHPQVWDLFLQVFDDGRLTDAQGNLADFRHSIIILTTNLGATEHRGSSLGFRSSGSAFSEEQVTRAIAHAFRPEFVNRIDRIVVFRPLSRGVMRSILEKELRNVLQRRGFRSREWAVEWEESAVDFLLDKGFTQDMGARPLRRAIDRYVLAPIAMTIVEHRFPEGDQFLFVRSDGRSVQVEFVDPDAPAAAEAESAAAETADETHSPGLASLVLGARGTEQERRYLSRETEALVARLESESWAEAKQDALSAMNTPEFWQSDDRYETIDLAERMDRIEAGGDTARSLMRRLESREARDGRVPAALVQSVAEQLHLLRGALADLDAGHPSDVYLLAETVANEMRLATAGFDWLDTLSRMYLQWAARRRMQCTVLRRGEGHPTVLAIAGFGAHHFLAPEAGLHLFEIPAEGSTFDRHTVRVRVVPQPVTPRTAARTELDRALECLSVPQAQVNSVTRRYREKPSPLVRDSVRGWRSGRPHVVLDGAFDCLG